MIKKFFALIIIFVALLIFCIVSLAITFLNKSDVGVGKEPCESVTVSFEEDSFCLLLSGRDKVSGLSDVIMLAIFDKKEKTACVLQIPRDTYADYGNSEYKKINGIFSSLGDVGALEFFEESFGIRIDGYLSIDLEGFRAIVDAIGGVDMTLDKPLKYSDPSQGLYIDLKAGEQTLDGARAEMLVRYRSGYARGDLDRLDTQKQFLSAFLLSVKKKINPLNIYSVASSALPYIRTDMSAGDMLSLALNVITVDCEKVCFVTLPGEDARSEVSGASFYVLSAPSVSELLTSYFSKIQEEPYEFDKDRYFLHPSLESFRKIYAKRVDSEVLFAEELK